MGIFDPPDLDPREDEPECQCVFEPFGDNDIIDPDCPIHGDRTATQRRADQYA